MTIFRQAPVTTSKQSPRVCGSDLFAALVQALVCPSDSTTGAAERQVAQLVVLKAFQPLLVSKRTASHGSRLPSDVLSYVALLTQHYQALVRRPDVMLPESLAFFEQDVQRAWPQIPFCAVRIQLLWVAIQLHTTRQLLPLTRVMELLRFEVNESYEVSSDEERARKGEHASGATATALDDGRLGGGVDCGAMSNGSSEWHDAQDVATVMTMMECLKSMAKLDPQLVPQLQDLQTVMRTSLDSASQPTTSSAVRAVMYDVLSVFLA
ncbi:hypothetical protein PINS_up002187 [Pythium insidiosum]|nr:hypothetical protein PINS_up002187 [Pythium insidiosum]